MKIQNVFRKSQDYNITMSRQEKHQRAEFSLKEVLHIKIHHYSNNYALFTKAQYVLALLQTIIKYFLVKRYELPPII